MSHPLRQIVQGRVVRNEPLCREHHLLSIEVHAFPPTAPGQFVQLLCRDPHAREDEGYLEHDWHEGTLPHLAGPTLDAHDALLRRPFSIASRHDAPGSPLSTLDFILRDIGTGTRFLATRAPGDLIDLIGPLGKGFTLPAPAVVDLPPPIALLVGGGVGIPPLIYLAQTICLDPRHARAQRPCRMIAFAGATTRDLLSLTLTRDAPTPGPQSIDPLYNVRPFADYGCPAVITTDDGSYGYQGFVTQALERYLDTWITDNADRARTTLFTCGPEPMMKAVQTIALRRSIACQIAVERAMACGLGTCQSCVIRHRPTPGATPTFKLACTDGPVFHADQLEW